MYLLSHYWLISITFGRVGREKTTQITKPSCLVQDKWLFHEKLLFCLWKINDCTMKTLSALLLVHISPQMDCCILLICLIWSVYIFPMFKYVGSYFLFICTYISYICMLIFSYSRDVLFFVCIIVRIDVADAYSIRSLSCS